MSSVPPSTFSSKIPPTDERDLEPETSLFDRLHASGVEAALIVAIWLGLISVPITSVLTGNCCTHPGAPPAEAVAVSITANALPWPVLTFPIFWACRRLRPDDLGWTRTIAGHGGMAVAALVAAEFGENAGFLGLESILLDAPTDFRETTLDPRAIVGQLAFLSSIPTYLVLVMIGLGRDAYLRYQHRRAQAERLQRETRRLRSQLTAARLDALRTQINPHFLFNTLHTISTMAPGDPKGTQRAIARLSQMLRYALSTSDQQEVSVRDEVRFLKSYLEIQKLRLGDRLQASCEVDAGARDARLPPLLLQPLVENATQHGVRDDRETIRIDVRVRAKNESLSITVDDDGQGLASHEDPLREDSGTEADDFARERRPDGRGLENLRQRLQGLYGDNASIALTHAPIGGVRVMIQIPKQIPTSDTLYGSGVVLS